MTKELTFGCGCKFTLDMFISQMTSVLDIVSDDDRIRLCVKHMNLLIDDYVKVINRLILSKSVTSDSTPVKTLKEKLKLVELYRKEYPKRLELLKEVDSTK